MNEKHLTGNEWVERVNELRQMVRDLDTAPTCADDFDYYLTSPDFFATDDFDDADKAVLLRELRRMYPLELADGE